MEESLRRVLTSLIRSTGRHGLGVDETQKISYFEVRPEINREGTTKAGGGVGVYDTLRSGTESEGRDPSDSLRDGRTDNLLT